MNNQYRLIPFALLMYFQIQRGCTRQCQPDFGIVENSEVHHQITDNHPLSLLEVCTNPAEDEI